MRLSLGGPNRFIEDVTRATPLRRPHVKRHTWNCMRHQDLLDQLRELEVALHRADVRSDRAKLSGMLHEEFWEIGRSGEVWSREATLAEFEGNPQQYAVWAQDFNVEELAPGVALLTYRSAHVGQAGALESPACRASVWVFGGGRWRMRFHQGTPTERFEKHAT